MGYELRKSVLPNDLFFEHIAEDISNGKKVRIRAKGNSMLPFIRHLKDEIVLKTAQQPVKKGMIVLAKINGEKYIVHRVEKIGQETVLLRGDGNVFATESCLPEHILAEVETVIRGKKNIRDGSFQWNLYRYLWPKNALLRRITLAIYRRIV